MNRRRQTWLGGMALVLAAGLIWARDLHWMAAPEDTLPLTLGLLLAYIIGQPWQPAANPFPKINRVLASGGLAAFTCGWIIGSLTLLAVGWTALVLTWMRWSFAPRARRGRLAWLLLLSFPWLVFEWPAIGWSFRLSSAIVAEQLFRLLQLPIHRDGTLLAIMGVPVRIEASCAGWNLLQLTLLAGLAIGTSEIRTSRRFALLLCLLPVIAWLGNLLRILILAVIALSFDTELASGAIHGLTGLVVLGAVLAITKGLCCLLEPARQSTSRIIKAP